MKNKLITALIALLILAPISIAVWGLGMRKLVLMKGNTPIAGATVKILYLGGKGGSHIRQTDAMGEIDMGWGSWESLCGEGIGLKIIADDHVITDKLFRVPDHGVFEIQMTPPRAFDKPIPVSEYDKKSPSAAG